MLGRAPVTNTSFESFIVAGPTNIRILGSRTKARVNSNNTATATSG
jgi:hypothetical protein